MTFFLYDKGLPYSRIIIFSDYFDYFELNNINKMGDEPSNQHQPTIVESIINSAMNPPTGVLCLGRLQHMLGRSLTMSMIETGDALTQTQKKQVRRFCDKTKYCEFFLKMCKNPVHYNVPDDILIVDSDNLKMQIQWGIDFYNFRLSKISQTEIELAKKNVWLCYCKENVGDILLVLSQFSVRFEIILSGFVQIAVTNSPKRRQAIRKAYYFACVLKRITEFMYRFCIAKKISVRRINGIYKVVEVNLTNQDYQYFRGRYKINIFPGQTQLIKSITRSILHYNYIFYGKCPQLTVLPNLTDGPFGELYLDVQSDA